jgi:hypothetical protein
MRGGRMSGTSGPTGRKLKQMSRIDDLIAAEGAAAENGQLPADVAAERRNMGRSVMFSIRLNPDELAALERYAGQRGLPARTLARAWILARLHEEASSQDDLRARVARLEKAVFRRSA